MQIKKHYHKLLLTMVVMSIGIITQAQKASLTGQVLSDNEPVAFANVFLKGTQLGSSTDIDGKYSIKSIPPGTYTVVASSLGFDRKEKKVTLKGNESIILNFELTKNSTSLNEVVVSGTMKEISKLESPVPVEVYKATFFKANPTPSIFESLQNVNGVRPQLNCNVCNTGDIHINGLEGPYTMVLIDGMPIVSGLSTVYGLTGIPQSLIERIEIVKGPASTLYGSEAVGGLVNIITKKPSNAPAFSAEVFGTGWGEVNTDLGVKYNIGKKAHSLFGVNYFLYQTPIDNNNDGFTDVTLQSRISLFNKINFDRKEMINFQFSANGHNQNSVYGTIKYLATQYIAFGQLTWNKILGRHDLLTGLTYRYNYYDDNTPATANVDSINPGNNPSITHLPGLFIQDEIALNQRNKFLLGLRYDYNSLHGNILSPRVNYKWTSLNKKNILRLSAGNGYRVANVFTEDHAALTGARTVEFEGELQPETSWNGNINFVKKIYTQNGLFIGLDASAFYTYFTNQILPDYDTNPNKIIYSNLDGSSVSQGVSLNLDLTWENGLKIVAGATLMDVSVEENGEKTRPVLTEHFQGVWSAGYRFKSIGLTLDYTGNLYGPMRLPLLGELDDRPEYSPWWSIQNIQLTKKIYDKWEIYGGIKNLLNYTPPANSIARAFDPFDKQVVFDSEGQVVPTSDNPHALTFDPAYVFAPNQGIRGFLGVRYTFR